MGVTLDMKGDLEKEAASDLPEDLDLQDVDDVLTQEMMNLSVKDRNDIQEEMHGVKCLAVEETPELVEKALAQMTYVIDELTPDSEKLAYLQSQQPPQEIPQHQRILHELHQLSPIQQSSYVNDIDFRLRFLRCDLFDVRKATKRMLKFLDLALELLASDFQKEEMRFMRYGRYQILPNRDRSGRRVSVMLAQHDNTKCPQKIKAKINLYQSWAIGYKDVETQRKGHVVVVWFDNTIQKLTSEKLPYPFDILKSTRVTAYFRLRRSLAAMRAGEEHKSKLRIHLGEPVELQYALQGYGIPAEDIPISWTGKVKIKNLVQWMRVRHAIEDYDEHMDSPAGFSQNGMVPNRIVECPQPHDVLFRKGNAYVSHFGNAQLRAVIEKHNHDDIVKRPKQLANSIFEDRQRLRMALNANQDTQYIGRYLFWDNQKDWWNVLNDREQICLKIEYMIREIRKSCSRGSNGKNSNTNSCNLCHFKRKNQKRSSSGTSLTTASATTISNSVTSILTDPNTVMLYSATSLFQSQDGWTNNNYGERFKKKQRKDNALSDPTNPYPQYNSSDDEDLNIEKSIGECFGIGVLKIARFFDQMGKYESPKGIGIAEYLLHLWSKKSSIEK
eukprot:CAMPEP_0116114506 /NCGR_PEP_ID=MMETSP0329-20121206/18_1 /TAXON_ID=697910 /ORGANISM="Pseudo-nitzschia arenysensis, Strain B593" /LENGTH=613 /DNA_ID=CAMNT_0003607893 /DNA_START=152 /DNA_END=1994 /DNA_ORIENTATION=-